MSNITTKKPTEMWYTPIVDFFGRVRGPSKKAIRAMKADEEFVSAGVPPEELYIFPEPKVQAMGSVEEEPLPLPKPAFLRDAVQARSSEDIFPVSIASSRSLQGVQAPIKPASGRWGSRGFIQSREFCDMELPNPHSEVQPGLAPSHSLVSTPTTSTSQTSLNTMLLFLDPRSQVNSIESNNTNVGERVGEGRSKATGLFKSAPPSVSNLRNVLKELEKDIEDDLEYFPSRKSLVEDDRNAKEEEAVAQFTKGLFEGLQQRLSVHINENIGATTQENDKINTAGDTDESWMEERSGNISSIFYESDHEFDNDYSNDSANPLAELNRVMVPRIVIQAADSMSSIFEDNNTSSSTSTPSLSSATSTTTSFSGGISTAPPSPASSSSTPLLPTPAGAIVHAESFAKVLSVTAAFGDLLGRNGFSTIIANDFAPPRSHSFNVPPRLNTMIHSRQEAGYIDIEDVNDISSSLDTEPPATISPSSSEGSIYSTESAEDVSDRSDSSSEVSSPSALEKLKGMRLSLASDSTYNPMELLRERLARSNKRHGVIFPSGFSPNDKRESLQFTKTQSPPPSISSTSYIVGVYKDVLVRVTPPPRSESDFPTRPTVDETLLHPAWAPMWEEEQGEFEEQLTDFTDTEESEHFDGQGILPGQELQSTSYWAGLPIPIILITRHDDVIMPSLGEYSAPYAHVQDEGVVTLPNSNATSIEHVELPPAFPTPIVVAAAVEPPSTLVTKEPVGKKKSSKIESPISRRPASPKSSSSSVSTSTPPVKIRTPTTPKPRVAPKPITPQAPRSERIRRLPISSSDSSDSDSGAADSSGRSSDSSASTIRPLRVQALTRARLQKQKSASSPAKKGDRSVSKPVANMDRQVHVRPSASTVVSRAPTSNKNVTVDSKRTGQKVVASAPAATTTNTKPSSPSTPRSIVYPHIRSSSSGKKENIVPSSSSSSTSSSSTITGSKFGNKLSKSKSSSNSKLVSKNASTISNLSGTIVTGHSSTGVSGDGSGSVASSSSSASAKKAQTVTKKSQQQPRLAFKF
ncbi:hypothetical protein BDN72DRAFT_338424 [Pluteus cervinus]|uniref:Uncharacterized protein n=1 Tax=Pluteus cervinus TaxID=181527 RepID=A0ACD3AB32_9AGAR|nr:hypothetical protein BDN72DRAFT_338424 [Pluteus cervinus]